MLNSIKWIAVLASLVFTPVPFYLFPNPHQDQKNLPYQQNSGQKF